MSGSYPRNKRGPLNPFREGWIPPNASCSIIIVVPYEDWRHPRWLSTRVLANIPDVGFILPDELALRIAQLYRDVPELEEAVLSFHGHDDLGVATANGIAAVRGGARQLEVAVNGLGGAERNTPLEEIEMEQRTGVGARPSRWSAPQA